MSRLILCPGIPRSGTTSLWTLLNDILGGEPDIQKLYAASAVLLQTAVELYTVALDDEAIEKIINITLEDIPLLRERMQKRLGERVLH